MNLDGQTAELKVEGSGILLDVSGWQLVLKT